MSQVIIEHQPSKEKLEQLGVTSWSIWTKEASKFPWSYDMAETCYFITGDVVVIPEGGEPVSMGKGDLVTFPKGMSCTWEIKQEVKKYYSFHD